MTERIRPTVEILEASKKAQIALTEKINKLLEANDNKCIDTKNLVTQ